ncbi:MAG TPA: Jag N-terminal domain-containing protein, partial [Candidatus Hydrogenedentes bacterium]|nr:Jag N-terminal domain-containing protein [Candidatus Hydrogenedentota bacterium]
MKSVEARGKTREEAIQNALRQLGVELYEVDKIEILDEGSRGLFGFGARDARVRLTCQHLHDTPARAESGGDRDRDRDRGRRGGRGRGGESRGGEREQPQRGQRGQGGQ